MPIKTTIFEDNSNFLDALSVLIGGLPELSLTGAHRNTRDIIEVLGKNTPDVVLMDIGIAPLDGIESTKLILLHFPSVRILIQTIFEDDEKVFAAICAGASGYVLKSYLPYSLLTVISEVARGGAPITPSIAGKILTLFKLYVPKQGLQEDYHLSKREKEVLKYLVEGASYKLAADKCFISIETVKTHIKKIYEKLHVASMSEAVAKAIHENLI